MSYNYYKILGVETYSSPSEIKRAYRRLAFKYHPDRNSEEKAKEFFQLLNEAYATLSDTIKKADYDRKNNFTENTPHFNSTRTRRNRKTPNVDPPAESKAMYSEKLVMPPAFARYVLFTTGLIFGLFMVVFPIMQTIEYTFSPTIIFIFLGFILTVDSIAGLTGYKTMIFFELFRMLKARFRVDLQSK